MQYVFMFLSGGQPGIAKDLQVKVAAARKVFRFMKVRHVNAGPAPEVPSH